MIRGNASEFFTLSHGLAAAGQAALPLSRVAIQTTAATVKAAWQANARATSGSHGKHYPNSITYETRVLSATAVGEIGPESGRPQGGMGPGFEFGSRNQPPHLDGAKAVQASEGVAAEALAKALGRVLP